MIPGPVELPWGAVLTAAHVVQQVVAAGPGNVAEGSAVESAAVSSAKYTIQII